MDELSYKLLGLRLRIEKNSKMSTYMKSLAGGLAFFNLCILLGAKINRDLSGNIIWFILSFVVQIAAYRIDEKHLKENKALEWEMYHVQAEDIRSKKAVAEITGEYQQDYVYHKEVEKPDASLHLPVRYYGFILACDLLIWICYLCGCI